jgi:hypothetical protein
MFGSKKIVVLSRRDAPDQGGGVMPLTERPRTQRSIGPMCCTCAVPLEGRHAVTHSLGHRR